MSVDTSVPLRFKPPRESEVQAMLIRFFTLGGWKVGSTSQYRASRVMLGLPDLLLIHRGLGRFAWWETKAPLERWRDHPTDLWTYYTPGLLRTWRSKPLSKVQQQFRDDALACGQLHGWGGLPEAEAFLLELGLGVRLASGIFQYGRRSEEVRRA